MTGRTHDLAAFTGLVVAITITDPVPITAGTIVTAFIANMVGGLAPDLDNATALLWKRIRGGAFIGKLIAPLLGGHRLLSHSLIGFGLFIMLAGIIGEWMGTFITVDFAVVWWSFVIGLVSHLIMDGLTKDGVPLLFPLPLSFGFPPLKRMRIRTGGFLEKWLIVPGLAAGTCALIFFNYDHMIEWIRLIQR